MDYHMIDAAPTPVAPFSHATETDGWVFVTGQMPTHPDHAHHPKDAPLPEGAQAQTRRVMDNLALVLGGLDLGWEHVTSVRIYLTEFVRDYPATNEAYASYFPPDKRPARTCIGVTALAVGALVEIDLVARRPS